MEESTEAAPLQAAPLEATRLEPAPPAGPLQAVPLQAAPLEAAQPAASLQSAPLILNPALLELLSEAPAFIEDFTKFLTALQSIIEIEEKKLESDKPGLGGKTVNSVSYLTRLEIQCSFLSILLASRVQQIQPDVLSFVSQVLPADFNTQAVFSNAMLAHCNKLTTLALTELGPTFMKMPPVSLEETEPSSAVNGTEKGVCPLMDSLTALSLADLSALLLFVQKKSEDSNESGTGQLNDGSARKDHVPSIDGDLSPSSILGPAPIVSSILGDHLSSSLSILGPAPIVSSIPGDPPSSSSLRILGPTQIASSILRDPPSSSKSALGNPGCTPTSTSILGDPPPTSSILGSPPTSTSSNLYEAPTLSSNVGDLSSISSSILGNPPAQSSILGNPPVQLSILGNPPAQSSILGDPTSSSSILGQPPVCSSILVQPPATSSVLGEPRASLSILGQPPSSSSVLGEPLVPSSILGEPPTSSSVLGEPPASSSVLGDPLALITAPDTLSSSSTSILCEPSSLLGQRHPPPSLSSSSESSSSHIPSPPTTTSTTAVGCASPIFSALVNVLIEQQLSKQMFMRRTQEPRTVVNLLDLPLLSPATSNVIGRESGMMGPPSLMGVGPTGYFCGKPPVPLMSLMSAPAFNRGLQNFLGRISCHDGMYPQALMGIATCGVGILGSGGNDGILGSGPKYGNSNVVKRGEPVEVVGRVNKKSEVLGAKKPVEALGVRNLGSGGQTGSAKRIPGLLEVSLGKGNSYVRSETGRSSYEAGGSARNGNRSKVRGAPTNDFQSWGRSSDGFQDSEYSSGNQSQGSWSSSNQEESLLGQPPGTNLQNRSDGAYGQDNSYNIQSYGTTEQGFQSGDGYYGNHSSLNSQPPPPPPPGAQSKKGIPSISHSFVKSGGSETSNSSQYNYGTYGAYGGQQHHSGDWQYQGAGASNYDNTFQSQSVGSTYQQKTTTENNAFGVNNNQSSTVVGSTAVPQVVSESQWSNGYYDSNGSYVYGTVTAQPIVSNNAPNNYSYGVSGSQQVALDGASTQYYGVNYNASIVNVAGGVPQPLMNTVTEGNTSYAWNYYQNANNSGTQAAATVPVQTGYYDQQGYSAPTIAAAAPQDPNYAFYGGQSSTEVGGGPKRTYEQAASYAADYCPVPAKQARLR